MENTIIYKEVEYKDFFEFRKQFPDSVPQKWERVLDDEGKEIGKKHFYRDLTTEEEVNVSKLSNEKTISRLRRELEELDFKTIKQVEAFLAGNTLPYSPDKFKELADMKQELRNQINDLEGS